MFPLMAIEWVESHQKVQKLSQYLNSVAGKTASLQHLSVGNWANISVRYMLPNEQVQLYLQGTLVENNIKKEIQKISTGTTAEHYIGLKLGLNQAGLQTIDWRALEKSQQMMSADR